MGQIGVAITNLPTVIFLKKPFSDGLGGLGGILWLYHSHFPTKGNDFDSPLVF